MANPFRDYAHPLDVDPYVGGRPRTAPPADPLLPPHRPDSQGRRYQLSDDYSPSSTQLGSSYDLTDDFDDKEFYHPHFDEDDEGRPLTAQSGQPYVLSHAPVLSSQFVPVTRMRMMRRPRMPRRPARTPRPSPSAVSPDARPPPRRVNLIRTLDRAHATRRPGASVRPSTPVAPSPRTSSSPRVRPTSSLGPFLTLLCRQLHHRVRRPHGCQERQRVLGSLCVASAPSPLANAM